MALTSLGRFLAVSDEIHKSDAIVVLSGDDGARLEQGVALYREGYAPLLILVGGGEANHPPAAEVMARQAAALGVPADAILLVTQSHSTREDALFTMELISNRRLDTAILVTSPYHQRRASLAFARVFRGSGVMVSSHPVQDDTWRAESWWMDAYTAQTTLVEFAKLAYYGLNGYL